MLKIPKNALKLTCERKVLKGGDEERAGNDPFQFHTHFNSITFLKAIIFFWKNSDFFGCL